MSSPAPALDAIKLALAGTNEIFISEVFGKRNFDALDLVYTADAFILPPGAPLISGRAAIKEFWGSLIESVNATSASLTSVEVMPSGKGVVEIGSATLTIQPEGQAASELVVKYVVYWLEEDGRWKWHVDIWNANS
jgi:ketosteroid isomerase-like protein